MTTKHYLALVLTLLNILVWGYNISSFPIKTSRPATGIDSTATYSNHNNKLAITHENCPRDRRSQQSSINSLPSSKITTDIKIDTCLGTMDNKSVSIDNYSTSNKTIAEAAHQTADKTKHTALSLAPIGKITPIPHLDAYLSAAGLTNVQTLDSSLQVDLRYARPDNFIGQTLYDNLTACYVLPRTARMLVHAQTILHTLAPEYNLLLLDCARPRRVQEQLWNAVKHRPDVRRYVAPPTSGSLHNFGAAVDVTLIDPQGKEVDMGTPYDFLGDLAQPRYHQRFLKTGELSAQHITNRQLLRRVMREAGFMSIQSEWWHFNVCTVKEARSKYKKIE